MIDLWHAALAWAQGVLQRINNIHREFGVWQIVENWKAVLFAGILLALAVFGGSRAYAKFSRHRLLRNAQSALQRHDVRGAVIFAMKLLDEDPNNLAASKVMAEAVDDNWPATGLYWHGQIEKLQPGNTRNYLEWARTALRAGDGTLARSVLDKVRPEDTHTGEYQSLAGKIAFSLKDISGSAAHLERAVAASPDRPDYAFDLAKVRLLLRGPPRVQGQTQLEGMLGDPQHRLEVLRILFRDADEHNQVRRALAFFAQLRLEPSLTTEDRMRYLDFLLRIHHPSFTSELGAYEKFVRTPEGVSSLAFWMNAHRMSLVAIEWLLSLPEGLRGDDRVQLALAESYSSMGDWPRLKALVSDKDWKDLDFLRAALLARCLQEQGDDLQAKDQWNLAVLKASDHPDSLARLCETAIAWGWRWETEAEDLAWRIVDSPHPSSSILDAMQDRFISHGETRKLYRLLARRLALDPSSHAVKNNFALVSLLLNKDDATTRDLAQQAYQEAPADARSGSTYALSLHMRGQNAEALRVMSRFGEQLRQPSVALYNGLFLAAAGEPGPARTYLKLAKQGQLLPEEEKLAEAAQATIDDGTPAPLVTGTTH